MSSANGAPGVLGQANSSMGRVPAIDYLRGLASLAVAWFHLTNTYPGGWVKLSGSDGWLGIEVFFVISGFVIPYSISTVFSSYALRDFPRYFLRRITRIEPPYFVSMLVVIALAYLSSVMPGFQGQQPSYSLGQVGSHLLYTTPLFGYPWIQPVYWTLAYEFVFYLAIGILFPYMVTRGGTLVLWAISLALALLALTGAANAIIFLFIIGIVLYRAMDPEIEAAGLPAVALIALGGLVMSYLGQGPGALVGISTAAVIYLLRDRPFPTLPARVLAWLGGLSYSLYLLHVPVGGRVVNLGRRFIDGPWQELSLSLVALVVSLLAAALFWRLVEQPSIRLGRKLSARRRRMALDVAA
jgi:peptidoglycan/LPS O-acetylase OafA/YrhL